MRNPAQRLRAHFDSAAVRLRSGRLDIALRLTGYGHGRRLGRLGAAAPRAAGNRVTYRRGSVDEWYVNGPLGLEQGFTLRSPPRGAGRGPLTLALAASGSAHATLAGGAVSFSHAGASLAYRDLAATDARGRPLRAWTTLVNGGVQIHVDDVDATYPIRVDPLIGQASMTASDGADGDYLGWSVAVSGNTIVAGAPFAKVGSNSNAGAAYVFTKTGTQLAKLTAPDGVSNDWFGWSVAVSGDTVVVGEQSSVSKGGAYVFTKPASGWADGIKPAKLTASDAVAADDFGNSVAVSGDTVVAGEPGSGAGAVYVFTKPASGWKDTNQTAKLTASDGADSDALGESVAIDGQTVVAGASFATDPADRQRHGAAYLFAEPSGGWSDKTQTVKLTASDTKAEGVGDSVAVSGGTVVTGAIYTTVGSNNDEGAAYVFSSPTSSAANATHPAKLTPADGTAQDNFGTSVAAYGGTIVVGAPGPGTYQSTSGGVYVFDEQGGGWSSEQGNKLVPSDAAAADQFGNSVGFDGQTIVAGAPQHAGGKGTAYTFVVDPTSTTVDCSPNPTPPGNAVTCAATVTDTAQAGTTPSGAVGFSSDASGGSFSSSSCTLAPTATATRSACSTSYTPDGTPTQTISVNYHGDDAHAAGGGATALTVATPGAPVATAPPAISGTPTQGHTLTEIHGSWSNSPTSYAYKWQRCDSAGANCAEIAGATDQSYTLVAADVGSTIRVQETASNATAAGAAATSAQTPVVSGPVTGDYVDPAVSDVTAAAQSPHAKYSLSTSGSLSGSGSITLTITNAATHAVVATITTPTTAQYAYGTREWGFSPDDDRFALHYVDQGTDVIELFDLTSKSASTPAWQSTQASGEGSVAFSPGGAYFLATELQPATNQIDLAIVSTRAPYGAAYKTSFTTVSPPAQPDETADSAHWGFSPRDQAFTFVNTDSNGASLTLVALPTGQSRSIDLTSVTAGFVQFSACGNVLGLVTQQGFQPTSAHALLVSATSPSTTIASKDLPYGSVAMRTTATDEDAVVTSNGAPQTIKLAAAQLCTQSIGAAGSGGGQSVATGPGPSSSTVGGTTPSPTSGPMPPTAQLTAAGARGATAVVALGCAGPDPCDITLTVKVVETLRRGRIVGVRAARHRRAGVTTRTVVLATKTVALAGGQSATVTLTLDARGRQLLARMRRLPAKLTIAVDGGSSLERPITFRVTSKAHRRRR